MQTQMAKRFMAAALRVLDHGNLIEDDQVKAVARGVSRKPRRKLIIDDHNLYVLTQSL